MHTANFFSSRTKKSLPGFVLASELVANCEELHYEDTEALRAARAKTQWHLETFGAVQLMVPNECSIVSNNYMSRLNKYKEMINRLRHLLNGKRCRIKWDNMRYLTALVCTI